jgi:hypothetical protein
MLKKECAPYSTSWGRIYQAKQAGARTTGLARIKTYGFTSTHASKYKLVGNIQSMLPDVTLYDEVTVDELHGFGEPEPGKMGNVEANHDDHVTALGLALEGVQREIMYGVLSYDKVKVNGERRFSVDLQDIKKRINAASVNKEERCDYAESFVPR